MTQSMICFGAPAVRDYILSVPTSRTSSRFGKEVIELST